MIKLYFSNGKVFVWNADDIYCLRKEHHIVGSLVGCYPIKPFQIQTKWLPLQLMPEEVNLLIDKGIAELVQSASKLNDPEKIAAFHKHRDKLCEEQVSLLKESRKNEILEKADKIYEGKKRKYMEALEKGKKLQKTHSASDVHPESQSPEETSRDSVNANPEDDNSCSVIECDENMEKDSSLAESQNGNKEIESRNTAESCDAEMNHMNKQTIIEAELAKVTNVSKQLCMVQLFTECPWKNETSVPNWKYPSCEKEEIRCAVYKDLWEKKYYITSGTKFGGDFLAYEGDPMKYHALFIVVCKSQLEPFQANDLVVYGRLGHQVKKTVALASLCSDGTVDYISLSWEREVT